MRAITPSQAQVTLELGRMLLCWRNHPEDPHAVEQLRLAALEPDQAFLRTAVAFAEADAGLQFIAAAEDWSRERIEAELNKRTPVRH